MEKISITDAIVRLQEYLESKGRSKHTHRAYLTDVRMFWEEMGLDEIALDDLELLAARWLTGRKRIMAVKTTARRLTTMKNLGRAFKRTILEEYDAPSSEPGRPRFSASAASARFRKAAW